MVFNVSGLVSIILFYLAILGIGIFAAYWARKKGHDKTSEDVMLAGRNIGLFVGIFTMTATWVGGGYINGTAEAINTPHLGLVWCQAPWGYALSLLLGGLIFAKKMREAGYVTMLDPFQEKFGERMGGVLYIPALLGELFWTAAILSALGSSLVVILDIENTLAICVSAAIAVFYTLVGGLYSVAYTDVVQLICIFIGLWLSIPFAMTHPAVSSITVDSSRWIGSVDALDAGAYIDSALMLIFGGIPWQVYFQRVLSAKTSRDAQILSFIASVGCIVMAIPAILIGAVANSTNWNETSYNGSLPISAAELKLTLPLVVMHLTPVAVAFIGLGAISAAVMSSADSSILSASSMFTRNILKAVCWQNASETALIWIMRATVVVLGAFATIIAIVVHSVYGLWFLCSDLVYCILFPQLFCVVHVPWVNTYGSLAGCLTGLFLRLTAGESIISLPAAFKYVGYVEAGEASYQRFPFRTFAMIMSFVMLLIVSFITQKLFLLGKLAPKYDVFHCYFSPTGDTPNLPSKPTTKQELQDFHYKNGNPPPNISLQELVMRECNFGYDNPQTKTVDDFLQEDINSDHYGTSSKYHKQ